MTIQVASIESHLLEKESVRSDARLLFYERVDTASVTGESVCFSTNRVERLVKMRNQFSIFAALMLVPSVTLLILGEVIEVLAPLSCFFGSLGSIIVLRMKIRDENDG